MPGVPDASPVALWGAVVATGLGLLRLWEFYRDRSPQLKVTSMCRDCPEIGHDVLLINAGRTLLHIYHFKLVWAKHRWCRAPKKLEIEFDLEDDFSKIEIAPFSTHRLNFNEARHFPTKPPKQLAGSELYLQAWIVGRRKPVWRKILE